ncbi:filaggrin [Lingula anatina]|uniref:Filaggrin n=1 Tax=Lingula anatina TaxID=7574 RepID=A0A1S3I7V1_LINAN|nr:filaggrin [Lingula anatina]|eukprot:XP_013394345.1 filaggrin [Lingula anatina]
MTTPEHLSVRNCGSGHLIKMASGSERDELEDLEALRSAVLASMKMKSKDEEGSKDSEKEEAGEDPELAALRAAALQTKKATVGKLLSSEKRKPTHHHQKREKKGSFPFKHNNRPSNLIVIQTAPPEGEENGTLTNPGQRETEKTVPVMLRPQDKWLGGLADVNSATNSPQREKPKDKFSRYESSDSEGFSSSSGEESEEEEAEEEEKSDNSDSDNAEKESLKSGSNQSSNDVSDVGTEDEDEDVVMETVDEVGGSDKSSSEEENSSNEASGSESENDHDSSATENSVKHKQNETKKENTESANDQQNVQSTNVNYLKNQMSGPGHTSTKPSSHSDSERSHSYRQSSSKSRHNTGVDNRSQRQSAKDSRNNGTNSLEHLKERLGRDFIEKRSNSYERKHLGQGQVRSRTHSREPTRHRSDRPHDREHPRRGRTSPRRDFKMDQIPHKNSEKVKRDGPNVPHRGEDRSRTGQSRSYREAKDIVRDKSLNPSKTSADKEHTPRREMDAKHKTGNSAKENDSGRANDKEIPEGANGKQQETSDRDSDSESSSSSLGSSSDADLAEDSDSEDDAQPWRFMHTGQGKKSHDTRQLFERDITDIERERRLKKHAESDKINTSLEPNNERSQRPRYGDRRGHERSRHRDFDRRSERDEKGSRHRSHREPGSQLNERDSGPKLSARDKDSKVGAKDVRLKTDPRHPDPKKDFKHLGAERTMRDIGSRKDMRDMHSKRGARGIDSKKDTKDVDPRRDAKDVELKRDGRDIDTRRDHMQKDHHPGRIIDPARHGPKRRYHLDSLPTRKFEDFESESESDSDNKKGPPLKSFLSVVKKDNAQNELVPQVKRPYMPSPQKSEWQPKRKKREKELNRTENSPFDPPVVKPLLGASSRPDTALQGLPSRITDARELIRKRRGKQENVNNSPEKVPKTSSDLETKPSPIIHVTFNKDDSTPDQSSKSRPSILQRIGLPGQKLGHRSVKSDPIPHLDTGSSQISNNPQVNRDKPLITPLMDIDLKAGVGVIKLNDTSDKTRPKQNRVKMEEEKPVEETEECSQPKSTIIRLSTKREEVKQNKNSERTEFEDTKCQSEPKSTVIKLNKKPSGKSNILKLNHGGENPMPNIVKLNRGSSQKEVRKSEVKIIQPLNGQEQEEPHDTRVFLKDKNVESSRVQYRDFQEPSDVRTFVKSQESVSRTVSIKSRLGINVENNSGSGNTVIAKTVPHVGGRKIKINRKVAVEPMIGRKVERSDKAESPTLGHERDAVDDLDAKIRRIQEKNAAILKRHIEIKEDKQIFGGNVV